MPLLVHITTEKTVKSILRAGIKPGRGGAVYCMPMLKDYFISHQWLRELKRHQSGMLVAVYFRISSQESVQVGHYNHSTSSPAVTLAEAIHTIMTVPDPLGYEMLIPRSIAPAEIHTVRYPRQIVGWRYMPYAHGKPICTCPSCIPKGQIKGSKLRKYYEYAIRNGMPAWKGSKT